MRKLVSIARTVFTVCLMLGVASVASRAQTMPPSKGAPTLGASAKFRITLNGFTVNHQSDDDILEGDGKGDEVYLRADVWVMNKDGAVSLKKPYRTPVLGDVNNQPNRKQAGSASNKGGLRTNDKYPTDQPWARGALQTLELPMLLWQGTLTQGEDGVAIIPTVWEWDSPEASSSETGWDNSLDGIFNRLKPELLSQIQNKVKTTDLDMASLFGADGPNIGGYGPTRPIGIDGSNGVLNGPWGFIMPRLLSLNYDSALEATKTSPSNTGLGVFAFRYTDKRDHGDYTLYIQVEKLN